MPMLFANADALPCPVSHHDLRFMDVSLSHGYNLSISTGKYNFLSVGYLIKGVQTVFETRRIRLRMLVEKHGTVASLNRALGWDETNARLYQIHNRSIRADRGTPYEMGDATARDLETKLNLETGWMDTPPTYAELHGEDDPRSKAILLLESMPPDQWSIAVRLLDALAKPADKNGTTG